MTIETLRLLECLLEKPVEDILDSLILKHLVDRRYFKHTPVVNGEGTPVNGDVTDEDSKVEELDRVELEKIVNRLATVDILGFVECSCLIESDDMPFNDWSEDIYLVFFRHQQRRCTVYA